MWGGEWGSEPRPIARRTGRFGRCWSASCGRLTDRDRGASRALAARGGRRSSRPRNPSRSPRADRHDRVQRGRVLRRQPEVLEGIVQVQPRRRAPAGCDEERTVPIPSANPRPPGPSQAAPSATIGASTIATFSPENVEQLAV